jgi:TetR/AcrR family transcriptional regulator, repressor of fatR-cypB operon
MNTKTAIYNATLDLIAVNGFLGTPVSMIAKKADISVGSIYHYFSGKEELLKLLYLHTKMNFIRSIINSLNKDLLPGQNLQLLLHSVFNYYSKNWKDLSFVEQYENSQLIDSETHEKVAESMVPLVQLFEKAKDEKIIKPLQSEMLISLSFGATIFLAKAYISRGMMLDFGKIEPELAAVWDMIRTD